LEVWWDVARAKMLGALLIQSKKPLAAKAGC
jgi:hypothetical protein